MKITLLAMNSSFVHTSLALRTLSCALRADGREVTPLEYTVKDSRTRVLEELYATGADVYGFSCYIWNISELLPLAEELKRLMPHTIIVFGGPEVSFWTREELDLHPFVDFAVTGEGEDALPSLCRDIENGAAVAKYPDGIVTGGAFRGFEEQGIPYTEKEISEGRIVYYESSRGCPFRCAYCLSSVTSYGDGQKRVRSKSAQRALDDLMRFESPTSSIRVVKFVDRTFNFDRQRAKEIWRGLLDGKYTKKYHFEVCASLLDAESLEILSQAPDGKFQLEIGVQSTNPETLRASDRPDDTAAVLDALRRLRDIPGVHVHADLIAGLPLESYESFKRSFDGVFGLCDQLQVGFLKLLKGCRLREDAEKYGIVFSPRPPYEVLKTDSITFPELCRLKRVAALVDRLVSSERFAASLDFMIRATQENAPAPSPFEFFESLDEFLGKEVTAISGRALYEQMFAYARSRVKDTDTLREILHRLHYDYLLGESSPIPASMSVRCEAGLSPEYVTDKETKKSLLADAAANGHTPDSGATVAVRLCFVDGVVLVDRKNRVVLTSSEKKSEQ